MAAQDAAAELVRLWPALPRLVGHDWPRVRADALALIDRLRRARTDEERVEHTESLLELLIPYPEVRGVLGAAYHSGRRSVETGVESADWAALCRLLEAAEHEQWINARFDGRSGPQPLRAHHPHRLILGVDRFAHPHAFASAQLGLATPPGADSGTLTVAVHGVPETVRVEPVKRSLTVGRTVPAPSAEPAEALFDITLLRDDRPVRLLAVISTPDGRPSQVLPITVHPAGGVEQETLLPPWRSGSAIASGSATDEVPVSVIVVSAGEVHHIGVKGPSGAVWAQLPHSRDELNALARDVRAGIGGLLLGPRGKRYEESLDIPQDMYLADLRTVTRSGIRFFRELFRPEGGSLDLKKAGDTLIAALGALGPDAAPRVEIVSNELHLPWHLLYAATEYQEESVSPYRLLGIGAQLTLVPLQSAHRHRAEETERPAAEVTAVIAVNTDIDRRDKDRPRALVSGQVDYWRRRIADRAEVLDDEEKVTEALRQPKRPDSLWYFYCHLTSDEPDRRTDDAALVFTGERHLRLRDAKIDAPSDVPLPGAPLVVLNACTSATPGAALRAGFPPYFLGKGARGVICTDIEVPTELGAEWARRFFDRLLAGVPVTTALHRTARDLLEGHRNLLCLLYTAFGTGNVRLVAP